jgi:hypothetical protein
MYDSERERLLYPNVIAATVAGDGPDPRFSETPKEMRICASFTTNNNDTVIRGNVYWYTPSWGDPVLLIEIDDEDMPDSPDNMDVKIRVRRNDGLVYEGTQADQEPHKCKICHEAIHQVKEWKHIHSAEMYCHTGDGSMAIPEEVPDAVD